MTLGLPPWPPQTEWGGGAGGYTEGDGTQAPPSLRSQSRICVQREPYVLHGNRQTHSSLLLEVVQMSKNEGKQVLSPDTEVNARSIRGLLHPPVLG